MDINKLESHERECAIRYKNIEDRLDLGNKKFDRLEMMLWGVYPFILVSIALSKFV